MNDYETFDELYLLQAIRHIADGALYDALVAIELACNNAVIREAVRDAMVSVEKPW